MKKYLLLLLVLAVFVPTASAYQSDYYEDHYTLSEEGVAIYETDRYFWIGVDNVERNNGWEFAEDYIHTQVRRGILVDFHGSISREYRDQLGYSLTPLGLERYGSAEMLWERIDSTEEVYNRGQATSLVKDFIEKRYLSK